MSTSAREPTLGETVEGLSDPEAYPGEVERVRVVRTATSVLFFTDERVFKLKQPLRREFRDCSRVDYRRHFCEEEVRLGRRLAPMTYLDVRPVTRDARGQLGVDGVGDVVDWLVEMVRLPEERMLSSLLEHGRLDREQLERLAQVLARFHERAFTGPSVNRHGLPQTLGASVRTTFEELALVVRGRDALVSAARLRELERAALAFLEVRRGLFERRVAEWRIRDGHGDLRAAGVCLQGDEVAVLGCVEYDRSRRCGDVAADLAFLTADMRRLGHPDRAHQLVRAYAERARDRELVELMPFYEQQRVLVRAAERLRAAHDPRSSPRARELALLEAGAYLRQADPRDLERPRP